MIGRFVQDQFQDILTGATVFVFHDFESFRLGPEVDAIGLSDHEGPFDGLGIVVKGLFGFAAFAIEDIDAGIIGRGSFACLGHSLLAISAGWVSIHEKGLRLKKRW